MPIPIKARLAKMVRWINSQIGQNLSKPLPTNFKPLLVSETTRKPLKPTQTPSTTQREKPENPSGAPMNIPKAVHHLIGYKFKSPIAGEQVASQPLDKFSTDFKISFEIEVELEGRF